MRSRRMLLTEGEAVEGQGGQGGQGAGELSVTRFVRDDWRR